MNDAATPPTGAGMTEDEAHGTTVNALIPDLVATPLTRLEDCDAQALQTVGGSADVAA